jgi:hypothetical protein
VFDRRNDKMPAKRPAAMKSHALQGHVVAFRAAAGKDELFRIAA